MPRKFLTAAHKAAISRALKGKKRGSTTEPAKKAAPAKKTAAKKAAPKKATSTKTEPPKKKATQAKPSRPKKNPPPTPQGYPEKLPSGGTIYHKDPPEVRKIRAAEAAKIHAKYDAKRAKVQALPPLARLEYERQQAAKANARPRRAR